jgi:hypothetical protein
VTSPSTSSYRLAERLRERGIYSGQARSTALFQLATDLSSAGDQSAIQTTPPPPRS